MEDSKFRIKEVKIQYPMVGEENVHWEIERNKKFLFWSYWRPVKEQVGLFYIPVKFASLRQAHDWIEEQEYEFNRKKIVVTETIVK